jgi:serine/threonine protein kinase
MVILFCNAHIHIIQALIGLQQRGICHRDISLENILINENTHALVIDLGMCLRVPYKSPLGYGAVCDSSHGTLRLPMFPQGRCGKLVSAK